MVQIAFFQLFHSLGNGLQVFDVDAIGLLGDLLGFFQLNDTHGDDWLLFLLHLHSFSFFFLQSLLIVSWHFPSIGNDGFLHNRQRSMLYFMFSHKLLQFLPLHFLGLCAHEVVFTYLGQFLQVVVAVEDLSVEFYVEGVLELGGDQHHLVIVGMSARPLAFQELLLVDCDFDFAGQSEGDLQTICICTHQLLFKLCVFFRLNFVLQFLQGQSEGPCEFLPHSLAFIEDGIVLLPLHHALNWYLFELRMQFAQAFHWQVAVGGELLLQSFDLFQQFWICLADDWVSGDFCLFCLGLPFYLFVGFQDDFGHLSPYVGL